MKSCNSFDATYLYQYTFVLLYNLIFTSLPVIVLGGKSIFYVHLYLTGLFIPSRSLRSGYQRKSCTGLPTIVRARYPWTGVYEDQILDLHAGRFVPVRGCVLHPLRCLDLWIGRVMEW